LQNVCSIYSRNSLYLERKKHTESNNEIIKANVRFQKTLSDLQAKYQVILKEKEELSKNFHEKELEVAGLKAQLKAQEQVTNKLLEEIHKKLQELLNTRVEEGEDTTHCFDDTRDCIGDSVVIVDDDRISNTISCIIKTKMNIVAFSSV
jgi:predicted nuclease with TOPRIM domain